MTERLLTLTDLSPRTAPPHGLETHVGDTPLLRLRRITGDLPEAVEVYAKAEWFNPGGSVKDRPAINILRAAIDSGQLTHEKVLLDSTSGNMGIAYATFGAALGYRVRLVIPGNASRERFAILSALGADLTVSSPLEGSDGAIRLARQIRDECPGQYFYADQYNNPANWQAHYLSTGPEIVEQSAGRVTHFVAGLGTSGTMMGTGRFLKEYNPSVRLIAFQPDSAFHGLEGLKHMPTAIRPGIYDQSLPDENLSVSTEEAHEMARRLGRDEGLFVGVSSAAAAVAALRVARSIRSGVVVTLFPDAGYKYVSESFWTPGEARS